MAARRISARKPDVIVLDVLMPGIDGIEYCATLKRDPQTRDIPVVLLTGSDARRPQRRERRRTRRASRSARSSSSPSSSVSPAARTASRCGRCATNEADEQLLLYASDLRHLLEIERQQRALLNAAYHDTVVALAGALESKDTGTRAHSQRVQRYAVELAAACAPELLEAIRASSTASCSTTSARSAFPTACCRSRRRCRRRAAPDRDAHDPRRADARGRVVHERRMPVGRSLAPRALGRRAAIRTASAATRSRSARACSPSLTRSTRSRATVRTAASSRGRTRRRRDLRPVRQAVRSRGRRRIPRARRGAARHSRADRLALHSRAWISS